MSGLYNAVPLVDKTKQSFYCADASHLFKERIYLFRMGLQPLLLTMSFIMLVINLGEQPNLELCMP